MYVCVCVCVCMLVCTLCERVAMYAQKFVLKLFNETY